MTKDFMSSEESGEEDMGGGLKRQVLFVKAPKWRAPNVDNFFHQIDRKIKKQKSKQGNNQTLPRVVGPYSSRSKPLSFSDDFYGFSN